jgi:hypothetical protein
MVALSARLQLHKIEDETPYSLCRAPQNQIIILEVCMYRTLGSDGLASACLAPEGPVLPRVLPPEVPACPFAPESRSCASAFPGRWTKAGLWNNRFEKFNRVTRRVFQKDLLAANSGYDVITKTCAGLAQLFDSRGEIGHLYAEPIPSAWLLFPAIRHRLASTSGRVRRTKDQAKIVAR